MANGRIRVLVAGDVYVSRSLVSPFLEDDGYKVVGEPLTRDEAMSAVGAQQPDVVVIDDRLLLPRQREAAHKVRAGRRPGQGGRDLVCGRSSQGGRRRRRLPGARMSLAALLRAPRRSVRGRRPGARRRRRRSGGGGVGRRSLARAARRCRPVRRGGGHADHRGVGADRDRRDRRGKPVPRTDTRSGRRRRDRPARVDRLDDAHVAGRDDRRHRGRELPARDAARRDADGPACDRDRRRLPHERPGPRDPRASGRARHPAALGRDLDPADDPGQPVPRARERGDAGRRVGR